MPSPRTATQRAMAASSTSSSSSRRWCLATRARIPLGRPGLQEDIAKACAFLASAQADYRIVFHMGTGGVKRYTERMHSLEYDYVARDGTGRTLFPGQLIPASRIDPVAARILAEYIPLPNLPGS